MMKSGGRGGDMSWDPTYALNHTYVGRDLT